jgi:hypothetical protein
MARSTKRCAVYEVWFECVSGVRQLVGEAVDLEQEFICEALRVSA